MYTSLTVILLLGMGMLIAGFIGRWGTDGFQDVSNNVASSLGMLMIFTLLVVCSGSVGVLRDFVTNFCGGIPYLNELADYGTLRNLYTQAPLQGAMAFLDTVILSAILNFVYPTGKLPWKMKFQMSVIATSVFVVTLALVLLNTVIKATPVYNWVAATIGVVITALSIGTVPISLYALLSKSSKPMLGILGIVLLFSKSRLVGCLRDSVAKALAFVLGIGILEHYVGSIANGFSVAVNIIVIIAPLVIMLIGLVIIVRAAFR